MPSYAEQHFCLHFFPNFFLAQVFLAQKCYKPGILDCWDLPHLWDKSLSRLGVGSLLPLAEQPSVPLWLDVPVSFLQSICRILWCCRAGLAACLSAAGVATSFARLVTGSASHYPSWCVPAQHPQSSTVSNDLLLLSSFWGPG